MIRRGVAYGLLVAISAVGLALGWVIVLEGQYDVSSQIGTEHPHVVVCPSGTTPLTPYLGQEGLGMAPVIECVDPSDFQAPIAQ